ncbi:NUDIX hydrolase [Nonomuraea africana]|uniref:8-oxo-dGTP diphosphatase n=1 Tax=Nonomuraea africana TaxID=46171 RepID=A0ABR9KPV9_9ACTN|nr:NUDIX domain-containing protein [Nonomuraea africana]MBE1564055.1 8-oxo-dGTP pyrophosphatase MutT (NUDIX family) [Nonomuraea africana]
MDGDEREGIDVVAAAVIENGRLLIVSKKSAPDLFYLPGGKPEPGESEEETLARELKEELGAAPIEVAPLARFEGVAALEGVPMRLAVFTAALDQAPLAAAELARLAWTDGADAYVPLLASAIREQVVPLLMETGVLAGRR